MQVVQRLSDQGTEQLFATTPADGASGCSGGHASTNAMLESSRGFLTMQAC